MKRVLCPGEALIDFVSLEMTGNLLFSDSFVKKIGGAPLNAVGAMKKMGVDPFLFCCIGNDVWGQYIFKTLEEYELKTNYVFKSNKNTTLAFVSRDEDGERDFTFLRGADQFLEKISNEELSSFDAFHFSSATAFLGGMLEETYNDILNYAVENKKMVIFDPNYRGDLFNNNLENFIEKSQIFIANSDIVKLSEEELYIIGKSNELNDAIENIIKLGCKYLIVTLGVNGSIAVEKNNLVKIPTIPIKMVDATGAGDAFIGTIIADIIQKEEYNFNDVVNAIDYASKVAAITTTKEGGFTSIPSSEEVNKYYNENIL